MHLTTGELYRDCPNCGIEVHGGSGRTDNICPFCDNGVYYSEDHEFEGDDKPEDAVRCEECGRYAHEVCAKEAVHSCVFERAEEGYRCPDHADYSECDSCGLAHDENCMVTAGEAAEVLGRLCEDCIYDDEQHLEQAAKALRLPLDDPAETRRRYYEAAQTYADASVCCTHLVRAKTEEEALGTLHEILASKALRASKTGYFGHLEGTTAVCLTEMTLRGLVAHAGRYSPFGLAFPKSYIVERKGGPALYIQKSHIRSIPPQLKPFVNKLDLDGYDFHHEREWRVPDDLEFEHAHVLAVYAPRVHHADLRASYPDIHTFLDLNILALM